MVDAAAVSRQVATDLDVELFQLQLVLVEDRVPQFSLFLLYNVNPLTAIGKRNVLTLLINQFIVSAH